jgi:nitroreductase
MLEIIRRRRSVRSYLNKDVEREKLNEVLKAAMFSPTARNLRPWEFVLITDHETKKKLSIATPYASFAEGAPVVLVICYDVNRGRRFKEDCSLCAENIYLEAVNQGLGTCFVQIADGTEADVGNPEDYVRKVLSIPEHFRVQCLLPMGYPEKFPAPHRDEEFEEGKIHYEKF